MESTATGMYLCTPGLSETLASGPKTRFGFVSETAVDIDTLRTVLKAINVEVVVQLLFYDSASSETVIWWES